MTGTNRIAVEDRMTDTDLRKKTDILGQIDIQRDADKKEEQILTEKDTNAHILTLTDRLTSTNSLTETGRQTGTNRLAETLTDVERQAELPSGSYRRIDNLPK